MHIYTSSFFKFRNKANFYSFLGASAGTGAPRNTQKIGTQCGCEYRYRCSGEGAGDQCLSRGWKTMRVVGTDGGLCQWVVAVGQPALMAVYRAQQRLPDDDPGTVTTKVEIGL